MKRAVICGATGYLGGHVVRAAAKAGYRVRALARDPGRLGEGVRPFCDEVFAGEATDAGTLGGLFDGADVAFSSIGVRHFRRRPTLWDVDCRANLNLVEEALKAGVPRFAFVSLLNAAARRHELAIAEARERVVDRIEGSAMSAAIVRPSGFFNDLAEVFEMAARGRVWLIGDGAARFNPIHGEDLAERIVAEFPGENDVEVDVGGPDVITLREAGEMAFAALGRTPRFGRVPVWLVDSIAAAARPFNANLAAFARMFAVTAAGDQIAPAFGRHHLADEMAALAAAARAGS